MDVMVRVEEGERERLLELVFALTYPGWLLGLFLDS